MTAERPGPRQLPVSHGSCDYLLSFPSELFLGLCVGHLWGEEEGHSLLFSLAQN